MNLDLSEDRIHNHGFGRWLKILTSKWFKISVETFDAIHYSGMALFKTAVFLFNLAPYLALRIVG